MPRTHLTIWGRARWLAAGGRRIVAPRLADRKSLRVRGFSLFAAQPSRIAQFWPLNAPFSLPLLASDEKIRLRLRRASPSAVAVSFHLFSALAPGFRQAQRLPLKIEGHR
jgi:hypothetical protein